MLVWSSRNGACYQHQRAPDQLADALPIGLYAAHAVRLEAHHAVGEQARAVQEVVDDEWLVHVELEMP